MSRLWVILQVLEHDENDARRQLEAKQGTSCIGTPGGTWQVVEAGDPVAWKHSKLMVQLRDLFLEIYHDLQRFLAPSKQVVGWPWGFLVEPSTVARLKEPVFFISVLS